MFGGMGGEYTLLFAYRLLTSCHMQCLELQIASTKRPDMNCPFIHIKMQMVSVCMFGAKQEKDVSLYEEPCTAYNTDEHNGRKNPDVEKFVAQPDSIY